jgi:hypothetical protein
MLEAVRVIPTNESFLFDTFCGAGETFPTQSIDVDFVKGKKKMSPFVAKSVNGIQIERNTVATKNYEPAKIQPKRPLTVETLEQRLAGEALYANGQSSKSPAQRASELLASDLRELKDFNMRRKEWIVAQSLFNGGYVVHAHIDNDKYIEETFEYGHTLDTVLDSGKKWNEANKAASKPLDDLQTMVEAIAASCGQYPSIVIMGKAALDGFLASAQVDAYFDKWNFNMGTIQPSIKSTQVQYIGRLLRPQVEIYTYAESYLDEANKLHKFVPDEKVLVSCPKVFSPKYAAHTQMENGVYVTHEGEDIPKYDAINHENKSELTLTSKPVLVPFDVDAWGTLTVV